MPTKKEKDVKRKMRIVILALIGGIAFIISILTNIVGMTNAINKAPDSSGMAGLSVRTSGKASLGTQKETKVNESGKIVEEDIIVNCLPIINLNNNGWDRVKSKFSEFQFDENGNAVFEEGYTLFCNGKYVNYVVFNNNYTKDIIGNIKVGTDLKTVEKNLGLPTFRTKNYIGYKTKEVYAFFYEDQIVIYPNRNISNKSLEELFSKYFEKDYGKERTYFLVDIRNNFEDIEIDIDDELNIITLKSITRQFIAKLDGVGNIEVELYNGYKVATDITQNYIKEKKYITNEEDLVEVAENERVSGK